MKLDPTLQLIHVDKSEIDVFGMPEGVVSPVRYVQASALADRAVMAQGRILTELEAMPPQTRLECEPEFRRSWMVATLALQELSYVPTN